MVQTESSSDYALLDSGATCHMVNDRKWFTGRERDFNTKITTAGRSAIWAASEGAADVFFGSGAVRVHLGRVLYVPTLSTNLISVS